MTKNGRIFDQEWQGFAQPDGGQRPRMVSWDSVLTRNGNGAGGENRTRVTSLEGWSFTTKRHLPMSDCAARGGRLTDFRPLGWWRTNEKRVKGVQVKRRTAIVQITMFSKDRP